MSTGDNHCLVSIARCITFPAYYLTIKDDYQNLEPSEIATADRPNYLHRRPLWAQNQPPSLSKAYLFSWFFFTTCALVIDGTNLLTMILTPIILGPEFLKQAYNLDTDQGRWIFILLIVAMVCTLAISIPVHAIEHRRGTLTWIVATVDGTVFVAWLAIACWSRNPLIWFCASFNMLSTLPTMVYSGCQWYLHWKSHVGFAQQYGFHASDDPLDEDNISVRTIQL